MARKPKTDHAEALAAFLAGKITKREYQQCWLGMAWVTKRGVFIPEQKGFYWELRQFSIADYFERSSFSP